MPRTLKQDAEMVKKSMKKGPPPDEPIPVESRLSLGNTMLNLSLSGEPDWGFAKGLYLWLAGDSSTGKTWKALEIAAEVARNRYFADYRIRYNDAENGALMDLRKYFGSALKDRLEVVRSQTIEDFYYDIYDCQQGKDRRSFLYIVDSMDALDTEGDEKKFQQAKVASDRKAGRGGDVTPEDEKVKGSMGMFKAKQNSMNIRRTISRLPENGSMLIILSQLRDDVGNPYGGKKASGGHALKYYAHAQVWSVFRGDMKRTVMGKTRVYGSYVSFDVRKNRISGRDTEVSIPYLKNIGFDEVGSMVDYLVYEGHWPVVKKTGKITAGELGVEGTREKIVQYVEDKNKEAKMARIVTRVWRKILEATTPKRKPRYT